MNSVLLGAGSAKTEDARIETDGPSKVACSQPDSIDAVERNPLR
jgi:hypothetical protein